MADHEDFHLPEPSALPLVVSFGIALMLFGFVPDSRLWRLALVSLGAVIALGAGWLWLRDSMNDYRDLERGGTHGSPASPFLRAGGEAFCRAGEDGLRRTTTPLGMHLAVADPPWPPETRTQRW